MRAGRVPRVRGRSRSQGRPCGRRWQRGRAPVPTHPPQSQSRRPRPRPLRMRMAWGKGEVRNDTRRQPMTCPWLILVHSSPLADHPALSCLRPSSARTPSSRSSSSAAAWEVRFLLAGGGVGASSSSSSLSSKSSSAGSSSSCSTTQAVADTGASSQEFVRDRASRCGRGWKLCRAGTHSIIFLVLAQRLLCQQSFGARLVLGTARVGTC